MDSEPLRRSIDLDAVAYLSKLQKLIREHENLKAAAEDAARKADASTRRSGQAAEQAARELAHLGRSSATSLRQVKDALKSLEEGFDRAVGPKQRAQFGALIREAETLRDKMNQARRATPTTFTGKVAERMGLDLSGGVGAGVVGGLVATGAGAAVGAAAGAARALASGLRAAVQAGTEFESAMSRVKARAEASDEQMTQLRNAALALGENTSFDATQVAEAMENLGASGLKTSQILAALPGVLSSAAAEGMGLGEASRAMLDTLNQFGLSAEQAGRVSDVLAKAAGESSASITDLTNAFRYAAPDAASLGLSVEETAAAVMGLAAAGIRGEKAGTSLRGAFASLLSPSEKVQEAMVAIGFSARDAQQHMKPLPQLVGDLEKSTRGMTEAQRYNAVSLILGTEAATGFIALMGQGQKALEGYRTSLEHADGAAAKMAETMTNNLAGRLDELGGAAQTLGIEIKDALDEGLKEGVETITDVVRDLTTWVRENGDTLGEWGEALADAVAELAAAAREVANLLDQIDQLNGETGESVENVGLLKVALNGLRMTVALVQSAVALLVGTFEMLKEAYYDWRAEVSRLTGNTEAEDHFRRLAAQARSAADEMRNAAKFWEVWRRIASDRGERPGDGKPRGIAGPDGVRHDPTMVSPVVGPQRHGLLLDGEWQGVRQRLETLPEPRTRPSGTSPLDTDSDPTKPKKPKKTDAERAAEREAERVRRDMEQRADRIAEQRDEQAIRDRVAADAQRVASLKAVADALAAVQAGHRAVAEAQARTDDADGAFLMAAQTGLARAEQHYDALRTGSEAYVRALDAEAQEEERLRALQRQRGEQAEQLGRAKGAHKAQIEAEIGLIDRQIVAQRRQVTEAHAAAQAAGTVEAQSRALADELNRLNGNHAFQQLYEEVQRTENGLRGIRPADIERLRPLFERMQGVKRSVQTAQDRLTAARASGDPQAEQQAVDALRLTAEDAFRQVQRVIAEFKGLTLPDGLKRDFERMLSADIGSLPEDWKSVRGPLEAPEEPTRFDLAPTGEQVREEHVRLLERAASTYDETASLAEAWGQVAGSLGDAGAMAGRFAGSLGTVLRALSQVKAMQAQTAAKQSQIESLREAAGKARKLGDLATAKDKDKEADALTKLMPSALSKAMPYVGAAMAAFDVAKGLFNAWEAKQEEEKRLRVALREAADAISDTLRQVLSGPVVGGDVRADDWAAAQEAMQKLRAGTLSDVERQMAYGDIRKMPGLGDISRLYDPLRDWLDKNGYSGKGARYTADQLLFSGDAEFQRYLDEVARKTGGLPEGLIQDIIAFRENMNRLNQSFGQFGEGVEGALARMEYGKSALGMSEADATKGFVDRVLKMELPPELRAALEGARGLDTSKAADRATLKALIEPFMQRIYDETFDWESFLDKTSLSREDVEKIFQTLYGAAGGPDGSGYSKQTQIAGTITEVQTNELLYWQAEQTRLLRAIEAILRQQVSGAFSVPPAAAVAAMQSYAAPVPYAPAAGAQGGSGGPSIGAVYVKAEHRLEDILEQIERELRRSGLF